MFENEAFLLGVLIAAFIKQVHDKLSRRNPGDILSALGYALATAGSAVLIIPFMHQIEVVVSSPFIAFLFGAGYGVLGDEIFKRTTVRRGGINTHDIRSLKRNMRAKLAVPIDIVLLLLSYVVGGIYAVVGVVGMLLVDIAFYLANLDKKDIFLEHYHVGIILMIIYQFIRNNILLGAGLYLVFSEISQTHPFGFGKKFQKEVVITDIILITALIAAYLVVHL